MTVRHSKRNESSLYRGENSQQAQGVESKTVAFIIKTAQIKRDENDVCL